MILKDFFQDDINRPIETVIKADDREHIYTEVSEYVVTQEISKKIGDFFQAYNNYQGANGVWISGFFGSGKSHMLKILSYVLENKEVDGKETGALFSEKILDDAMLKGDVKAAVKIPSESILFNIDQQAQITSKEDPNAILSVFYKVFYDHLGYYGFRPHVAEMEMWLDKQGKFSDFKKQFGEKHGKTWEVARVDYFDPLVTDNIAEVLGNIFGKSAEKYEDILDDMEDRQKQSIEDFCERVDEYIKTKATGFRLNFFVDEIGQFISDNTKLMLNLQTIAETLATRTKGNSWILVTSQEDMETVVGDMGKKQQNDFSRIQARFKIKVPLTSANVDEVIQKRLLDKKTPAVDLLKKVWTKENAHLATLLTFSDAGIQYKGYQGEKDFIGKYPFVPYQFDLFQSCRRALSSHNAFQGRHSSVGERSMLGVFQQVVVKIQKEDENAIVSFDKMFEGIRGELQSEIYNSIITAERQLGMDSFEVKVLKALFMVKYYNNFKTTKRNISVMMIDDIHVDLKVHETKIENALSTLENQSYIQRNGEFYEFLTDDEKDVETEIKSTDIDDSAVTSLLKEVLFDEIIGSNKIRFLENKQDYDFSNKIDGTLLGREKELVIEIITPLYDDYENTAALQSQTMGTAMMRMILPPDVVFIKDLKMYLKTAKYVKQSQSTTNRPELKRILSEKAQQNGLRRKGLLVQAKKLLAESNVYMNGAKHEMPPASDGKTKVMKAFQDLIRHAYRHLNMLGSVAYSEESIKNTLRGKNEVLFTNDNATMSSAEKELLTQINRRKNQSDRTSLNELRTIFERKPYGWYPNAIWTNVAQLYKRGKVELRQDSNLLDDEGVLTSMINSKNHLTTMVEVVMADNPEQIKKLKQCYSDLFDASASGSIGKEVANNFRAKLKEMHAEVQGMLAHKRDFEFLKVLEPFAEEIDVLSRKEYGYFLEKRSDFEDKLLDFKEDTLDPIRKFWNSEQKNIFESIGNILKRENSNFEYIEGNDLKVLNEVYTHEKPYTGTLIKEAKTAKDAFSAKMLKKIEEERAIALGKIKNTIKELESSAGFKKLEGADQEQLTRPFTSEIERLSNQRYIANIRQSVSRIEGELLPNAFNAMVGLLKPATSPGVKEPPQVKFVHARQVPVKFGKKRLETEADIDEYVEALRKAYKEEIQNHKRIVL